MATRQELIAALDPAYWAWIQDKPNALAKLNDLIAQARQADWAANRFMNNVQQLKSWGTWSSGSEVDPVEEEVTEEEEWPWGDSGDDTDQDVGAPIPGARANGDGTWTLQNGTIVDDAGQPVENQSIFQYLKTFLADNGLPETLIAFIKNSLIQDKPAEQIIAELRQTPEYKASYPENDMRRERGLSWMPESWIRDYRNEAKRLAREYMGIDASNTEIAQLIGRGVSLQTWEHRLQINDAVRRWGGGVQQVFEQATGAQLSAERLHAFFDPNQDTADLDEMYDMSLRRGQVTTLGFAIRPEEEAEVLRSFGLSAEQVFKNYSQIRSELPRFERLAAIGNYLDRNGQDFFGDVSVSGSLLFRAVQLGDPAALKELQRRNAEESARWQAGGGPQRTQGGAIVGLSAR